MPKNCRPRQRRIRQYSQIGVAQAGGDDAHQNVTGIRLDQLDLVDRQRAVIGGRKGGVDFHGGVVLSVQKSGLKRQSRLCVATGAAMIREAVPSWKTGFDQATNIESGHRIEVEAQCASTLRNSISSTLAVAGVISACTMASATGPVGIWLPLLPRWPASAAA